MAQGCLGAVEQAWQCSGSPHWAGGGGEDWPSGQEGRHDSSKGTCWNAAEPDPRSPSCCD